jgi:putative hydrolase of the HAD superfamily
MARRFDALIVDFGGVLTSPLHEAMLVFAHELEIDLQDLVQVALRAYAGHEDELVHGFETGIVPEDEFSREFARRLADHTGKEIDPVGIVDRIFGKLAPEESMFDAVLLAKKAGYKTALCSNSWGLGVYPKHRFPEMFDVVVISGEVGMRKPNRDIFDFTIDQLGVDPALSIFVDDHPGHLKTAGELGMTTVLHREPHQTIAELESLLGVPLTVS